MNKELNEKLDTQINLITPITHLCIGLFIGGIVLIFYKPLFAILPILAAIVIMYIMRRRSNYLLAEVASEEKEED